MERTIDGIDYIAKSEVLGIIAEHMQRVRSLAADDHLTRKSRDGWLFVQQELDELRYQIQFTTER